MIGVGIGLPYQRRGGGSAIAGALATRAGISWRPERYATTLFTDTAGTVPASQPGDIIAVQKDPTNLTRQFQQTTVPNRPILVRHPKRGRVNLLTYTEQFDNAAWTKSSATITANDIVAPDGTTTADLITGTGAGFAAVAAGVTGVPNLHSFYVKAGTETKCEIWPSGGISLARFDLTAVTATNTGGTGATITAIGSGWYRISVFYSTASGQTRLILGYAAPTVTTTLYVWGAQLEIVPSGTSPTAYQKVTSTYDITESGQAQCWGLLGDGVNDSMATAATLDLSGSDKVAVFAGVQKLSDAARGTIIEHTASVAANNGGFQLTGPDGASATHGFESKGTVLATASGSSLTSPIYSVLTGIGSIATDGLTLRRNGASIATAATDQGTGNFANATLYMGARGGASQFASMINWGGCVVSGLDATTDATLIAAIEKEIAQNTPGVYL